MGLLCLVILIGHCSRGQAAVSRARRAVRIDLALCLLSIRWVASLGLAGFHFKLEAREPARERRDVAVVASDARVAAAATRPTSEETGTSAGRKAPRRVQNQAEQRAKVASEMAC